MRTHVFARKGIFMFTCSMIFKKHRYLRGFRGEQPIEQQTERNKRKEIQNMLINGRPYSNENGYIDDGLITSHTDEEIKIVRKWIRDNIIPAKKILQDRTSYGLKHLLEHDTDIYLTNNEFKDAMLFEGYIPQNPNALNWKYRIRLKRDINDNPGKFFKWAKEFEKEASPYGDFARDMVRDMNFPRIADYRVICRYLYRIGACSKAIDVFEEMWRLYERESN